LVSLALGLLIVWSKDADQKSRSGLFWIIGIELIAWFLLIYPVLQDAILKQQLRLPLLNVLILIFLTLITLVGPSLIARCRLTFRPHLGAEREEVQKILVGLVLLLLPIGAAFGTNNTLLWQIWIHVTPWFGLLLFLFAETQMSRWIWPLGWIALAFVVAWIWSQWIYVYWFRPYRLTETRVRQTETLNVRSNRVRGLKVDAPTKAFFEKLDATLAKSNFEPGMGVIGLYDMPGIVYISDGFSPGDPWYLLDDPWKNNIIDNIVTSKLPNKSALILTSRTIDPVIAAALARPEIDFPNSYRQVGQMVYLDLNYTFTLYDRPINPK
jgi:hypothetical protein